MEDFWNERYAANEYCYGEHPNTFLKDNFHKLIKGNILMPAEGEGRNAVFLAENNFDVYAFDFSIEAKKKANRLAQKREVQIKYEIKRIEKMDYPIDYFDNIGLFFVHLPETSRFEFHQKLIQLLKPGGRIILEGFHSNHLHFNTLNPKAGGPKNVEFLFSKEIINSDFKDLKVILFEEIETELHEGEFHCGKSALIRFIGEKK